MARTKTGRRFQRKDGSLYDKRRLDIFDETMRDESVTDVFPFSLVVAMIDEVGDLGSCEHGDEYVLGATVIESVP